MANDDALKKFRIFMLSFRKKYKSIVLTRVDTSILYRLYVSRLAVFSPLIATKKNITFWRESFKQMI